MEEIIHNLRQKPDKIKKRILAGAMIISALILLLLWIYSLGAHFAGNSSPKINSEDVTKPFSALKDNLVNGYRSISE